MASAERRCFTNRATQAPLFSFTFKVISTLNVRLDVMTESSSVPLYQLNQAGNPHFTVLRALFHFILTTAKEWLEGRSYHPHFTDRKLRDRQFK